MGARVGLRQGRIQKKRSEGGQTRIFAQAYLPFPYTYHVKDGQFGGGGSGRQKRVFVQPN